MYICKVTDKQKTLLPLVPFLYWAPKYDYIQHTVRDYTYNFFSHSIHTEKRKTRKWEYQTDKAGGWMRLLPKTPLIESNMNVTQTRNSNLTEESIRKLQLCNALVKTKSFDFPDEIGYR